MNKVGDYLIKVMLTNACNLNCKYCYEKNKANKSMKLKTAIETIDFYFDKYNKFDSISSLRFHGGEPLLQFDILKEMVYYFEKKSNALNKDSKFELTTNGTLINEEIANFINEHDFKVTVSLDGNKSEHDKNRVFLNGEGSYAETIIGLKTLRNIVGPNKIFLRLTITPDTVDSLYENIRFLMNLGYKKFRLSLDFYSNWIGEEFKIEKQFTKLKNLYIENRGSIYLDIFDGNYTNYILENQNIVYCNAGLGSVIVDTDGILYPCAYSMDEEFQIGNIWTGVKFEKFSEIIKKYFNKNNQIYKKCKECEVKRFCMGLKCSFVNLSINGKLNVPPYGMCVQEKILYYLMKDIISTLILNNDYEFKKLVDIIKSKKELSIIEGL
ncbi:TPA: radical SAM protein [Streptococcus agalactiae]